MIWILVQSGNCPDLSADLIKPWIIAVAGDPTLY